MTNKFVTQVLVAGLAVTAPSLAVPEEPSKNFLSESYFGKFDWSAYWSSPGQVVTPTKIPIVLLTWFHTGAPAEMAFIRPGMDWPNLTNSLVVVAETPDAAAQLDPSEWIKVIEMDVAVPVFGKNISEGLSSVELSQLMNNEITSKWIACCANMGSANAASNFQFLSNQLGVDPKAIGDVASESARLGLSDYFATQDYMEQQVSDGQPSIAIGLRGVPRDSSLSLVTIDGYHPGQDAYPLQTQSQVYIRKYNFEAAEMLQRALDFETGIHKLDLQQMGMTSKR